MEACQVIVETERAASHSDVLVRAIASVGRMNDGRPIAGFLTRRRYHGDTFYIQSAGEFSASWMEFVDTPPQSWVEKIKAKYPQWKGGSRYEAVTPARNVPQSEADVTAKISSTDFDYSNGAPRKRGRPRLNLEETP